MNRLLKLFSLSLLAIVAFLATSCKADGEYQLENNYRGSCTLIAMGDTVSYDNSVHVENKGKKIIIDSIAYGRFVVKRFEIGSLRCDYRKKTNEAHITMKDPGMIVEAGGMRFEIKSFEGNIKLYDADFKILIHPLGMPGDGFLFTHKGEGMCFE